jgi:hypothetical protein
MTKPSTSNCNSTDGAIELPRMRDDKVLINQRELAPTGDVRVARTECYDSGVRFH